MSHEQIISVFEEWAANGKADRLEHGHGDVVRQVIGRMELRPGMQSLDLGCGTGWATRLLAAAAPGAGAVGVDAAPAMIARAEELHDLTSRARYEVGTFEVLDFPDARFDRVFSMEALYYAVDLPRTVAEVHRVLKPGGAAHVVVDRFKESPHTEGWSEQVGIDMHFLGEAEWRAAFEDAGFAPVELERVVDSRGPGDEASFTPNEHCPDWRTHLELHEAGSLWIRAHKPL